MAHWVGAALMVSGVERLPAGKATPLTSRSAVSVCAQPLQASVNYYVVSEEVAGSADPWSLI